MNNIIEPTKLEALSGKVVGDIAGALGILMAYLGDQAGLYTVMDENGPQTISELATVTGMNPKYLREWLGSNSAAGYVTYDEEADKYSLSEEQALVFTREGQPACLQGFFQVVISQFETLDQAVDTFRSGNGRAWGQHAGNCFCATDRFFRPGYAANLLEHWIPALDGVSERLSDGAVVADIGCGHGSSSILLAKAFPRAKIVGIDFHGPSIEAAKALAESEGLNNLEFHVGRAQDYPGKDYDFACIFDALHDMGDPVGAAAHIRQSLKPDGTLMLVEPLAGDSLSENLHPLGQIFYALSTTICTPASLAQEVGLGLGAQAGQARLTSVMKQGGFSQVRRAAETGTNMVLEVRP